MDPAGPRLARGASRGGRQAARPGCRQGGSPAREGEGGRGGQDPPEGGLAGPTRSGAAARADEAFHSPRATGRGRRGARHRGRAGGERAAGRAGPGPDDPIRVRPARGHGRGGAQVCPGGRRGVGRGGEPRRPRPRASAAGSDLGPRHGRARRARRPGLVHGSRGERRRPARGSAGRRGRGGVPQGRRARPPLGRGGSRPRAGARGAWAGPGRPRRGARCHPGGPAGGRGAGRPRAGRPRAGPGGREGRGGRRRPAGRVPRAEEPPREARARSGLREPGPARAGGHGLRRRRGVGPVVASAAGRRPRRPPAPGRRGRHALCPARAPRGDADDRRGGAAAGPSPRTERGVGGRRGRLRPRRGPPARTGRGAGAAGRRGVQRG